VQQKVNKTKCHDFESFKKCVTNTILSDPEETKDFIAKLYTSMPKRLAKVVELDGDLTGY